MTNTCRHDFQFCYKGNRGIALAAPAAENPQNFGHGFAFGAG